METIKLVDTHFAHAKYSTDNQESKYITRDRSPVRDNDKLVVYTDTSLNIVNKTVKKKIGWMLESPAITSGIHEWIGRNYSGFDMILTNNKKHIDINSNVFKFSPTAGCWIFPKDQMIYPKKKLTSGIFSDKKFTKGQAMRHQAVTNFKDKIDVFGRGYFPLPNKIYGLKDYGFSLVIENCKQDYYFTEKLIDCFVTGTIPIYWGCPSIGNFFDVDGMICFNDIHELSSILKNVSLDLYNSKIKSVEHNFLESKKYLMAEDYMFENYLKNMI